MPPIKLTRVLTSETTTTEATIHMLGENDKRYSMVLSAEVVAQLRSALLVVATRLQTTNPAEQNGILLDGVGCQPFWSERGQGIVIVLKDGLEFALHLDQKARTGLRACIDQLEAQTPKDEIH